MTDILKQLEANIEARKAFWKAVENYQLRTNNLIMAFTVLGKNTVNNIIRGII